MLSDMGTLVFVTIVSCILYSKESYHKFTLLIIKNHRFDFDEAFCLQTNYYPQYALHNATRQKYKMFSFTCYKNAYFPQLPFRLIARVLQQFKKNHRILTIPKEVQISLFL
jgi:hypothetical protein